MSLKAVLAYRSLTLATFFVCIIATFFHIIAYATPYWLESDGNSPFINIGWHQACFDHCHHPYCPGGDPDIIFDGCYVWAFNDQLRNDYNFQEMVQWLFPRKSCRSVHCFLHVPGPTFLKLKGDLWNISYPTKGCIFSKHHRSKMENVPIGRH